MRKNDTHTQEKKMTHLAHMTAKHTLKLSTDDSVLPIHTKPEAGVNNGYYWLDAVTYQCVMINVRRSL